MTKRTITIVLFLYLTPVSILFSNCGDMFAFEKKIYKNYYLLEDDGSRDIGIAYKVEADAFVGRVPSPVIAYSIVKDSFLIAKRQVGPQTKIYILDLKRDNPYADDSTYLRGIVDEAGFDAWMKKNNIDVEFRKVVNR